MTENEISAQILDAAIAVHREIGGPGVLVLTYLKLTNLKLGVVINFGKPKIVEGYTRVANGTP